MARLRFPDPRRSFAAKLALAVLATVGLLLVVVLSVVQAETRGQVDRVTDAAVARAREAFEASERVRLEQLGRRVGVFTDSRRTVALLEAAIEAGDTTFLANQIHYALQLTQFDSTSLTVLTDAAGDPLLTFMGAVPVPGDDPARIGPVARELLAGFDPALTAYRMVDGRLYTVRTVVLDLAGRVVGTTAFGQPIRDEDAEALGRLAGAEVCFVAEGRCVAGTALARSELAPALAAMEAGRTLQARAGERWELVVEPLREGAAGDWRIAMAVPMEPVLAPFDRIRRTLGLGALGALLLALLLGVALARGLARPLRTLVAATRRVGRGEYDTRVPARSRDEVGQLARAFNTMTEGLALKEQYRGVLDKVVSKDVAEELLRGELKLGGELREVTVLFADVRGFTALTEGMAPQAVIGLLNETMERMSDAVEAAGGVVDKYVGDEIMAVFGAPLAQPDHSLRAVGAALAIQSEMAALSAGREARGEAAVAVGVGVHTGEAVAGNMGSPSRLNYTVVGESVNLAARLCSAAGPGQILVSGVTRDRLVAADPPPDGIVVRPSGARDLKGFSRSVEVFTVSRRSDSRRASGSPGAAALALAGMLLAAGAGPAAPAAAQSLPTLTELGLEWISPTGAWQVGLSGRADLEAYAPGGAPPWIIPETEPFLAGRARVFADVFAGRRVYGSVELRADRGEEPRAGPLDARVDQAFLRVGPFAGLSVQAGKFVSPFGGWAQRHHTVADPFIRPPIMYDHRTMIRPGIAPATAAAFLAWKDDVPRDFRPLGAPPIWGAPYQWGGMVLGRHGPAAFRVAAMNSAPSSEPESWGWDPDALRSPSWVVALDVEVLPELRLGASWNRGPYLTTPLEGEVDPGWEAGDYVQELLGVEAVYARGGLVLRGEALADRWEVPNVRGNAWDLSAYLEAQYDLAAGVSLAARAGALWFNELDAATGAYGSGDDARWDYNARRLQLAAGYRILRNLGVRGELMMNGADDPDGEVAGDLFSLQLWWSY